MQVHKWRGFGLSGLKAKFTHPIAGPSDGPTHQRAHKLRSPGQQHGWKQRNSQPLILLLQEREEEAVAAGARVSARVEEKRTRQGYRLDFSLFLPSSAPDIPIYLHGGEEGLNMGKGRQ